MNDYLAKPIEEEKLHALLLRYQPGVHSIAPAAIPPTEPVIDHNQTLDWQLALRQGGDEARSGEGDAADADRFYAGGT